MDWLIFSNRPNICPATYKLSKNQDSYERDMRRT